MYPRIKPQVLQVVRASMNDLPWPMRPSSPHTVTPLSTKRAVAIFVSLRLSLFELPGKSGSMRAAPRAKTTVAAPYRTVSMPSEVALRTEAMSGPQTSTMKSHLHPRSPQTPSIPPVIAPANKPPKAPERIAADMKTVKRRACSSFLYQEEMINRMPGAKPDSKMPTKMRNTIR